MLYVAGENIPAGHYVVHPDPRSEIVRGLSPFEQSSSLSVAVGIARENLREGFRVCVRDNGVYEDDA